MENPVVIFGANQLGLLAYDIFKLNDVVIYGFLDDESALHQTEIGDVSVLGNTDDDGFLKLIGKKCEACVAVEDRSLRRNIVEMLNERRHVQPVNAVHPTAVISELAVIGHGNLVAAQVVVSPKVTIGQHCVVQSGVVIEPNVTVGSFVNIGSKAVLGAGVTLADDVFVGAGAVIVSGLSIGKGASIGVGSVVVENVPAGARVFGNPAQKR